MVVVVVLFLRNPEKTYRIIIESLERTIKYYDKIPEDIGDKILLKNLKLQSNYFFLTEYSFLRNLKTSISFALIES